MAKQRNNSEAPNATAATVGHDIELWQMADALRGSMDAAEYKHVTLGVIFLKYTSDAFDEQQVKLVAEKAQADDSEDPHEYRAQRIFWVAPKARWSHLKPQAKQPTIGQLVDDGMPRIECDNPQLKGVLLKDYARPALDKERLGQIVYGNILHNDRHKSSRTSETDVILANPPFNISGWGIADAASSGG